MRCYLYDSSYLAEGEEQQSICILGVLGSGFDWWMQRRRYDTQINFEDKHEEFHDLQ